MQQDPPATDQQTPSVPTTPVSWSDLGLSADALKLLEKAGFTHPTPVQAASIPLALDDRDLIASAQTGSGKTAAFSLPLIEKCVGREGTFGLILAPTREIAQQTQATLEMFATPRGVRSIVLIGGIDMRLDAKAIQSYPQIIVATPGRLCDHLDRGNIWLEFIQCVILDEADRMLDMGFSDQLNRIMEDVPKNRQTMVFSATFPPSVERLARKILHEPERVMIGQPTKTAASVEQKLLYTDDESKLRELLRVIEREPGSIIVFTRSKDGASRLWRSLHSRGMYEATYIHSDRRQSDRELALAEFKSGKYRILIATDVAGRGIHVEGVAHVVNYDLPMEPEDYIHRIGRTGRIGATGKATTFVTRRDRQSLASIERLVGEKIPAINAPREEGPRSGEASSARGAHSQEASSARGPRNGGGGSNSQDRPPRSRGGRGRRGGRGSGGGGGGGAPSSGTST